MPSTMALSAIIHMVTGRVMARRIMLVGLSGFLTTLETLLECSGKLLLALDMYTSICDHIP